jgi:peptidoglycan/xylan/chitin deacetylase (PgdA/CDA1 family)
MMLYDYEKDEKIFARAKRKSILMRSTVILLGVLVLVAGMILAIRMNMNVIKSSGADAQMAIQPVSFQFSETPKNVGTIESVIEYEKDHAFGIRFPKVDNDSANAEIQKDVDAMLSDFREEIKKDKTGSTDKRAVYTVDYDIYSNSDRYVSVVYHIEKKLTKTDQTIQVVKTKLYDLTAGEELSVTDVFEDSFLSKISSIVTNYFETDENYQQQKKADSFEERLSSDWEHYQHISFSDQMMTLYLNHAEDLFEGMDGVLEIAIPIEDVFDTMKINITGYTPPSKPDINPSIDPNKPMIALTFDDGPYPKVTERILDQLEKCGGRATFFVLGNRVEGNVDTLKRADSLGCEIASHTYDHQNLTKLTPDAVQRQVQVTNDLVHGILSKDTFVVRPPYGATNDMVCQNVGKPMITWSLDTLDWKTKNSAQTISNILDHVQDGDIVLMHDLYTATADACDVVIPELVKRGYQLVTVSELMEVRGVDMQPGKIYYKARP